MLFAAAKPVKLLRKQAGRAGVNAQATADTGLFRLFRCDLIMGRRQDTVADFNDRHVEGRQGKAHQRPTHHHHLLVLRLEAGERQQMLHGGANARPQVARLLDSLTGQGDHALNQRFAVNNRPLNGKCGTDVLHQHADSRGVFALRHFLAG